MRYLLLIFLVTSCATTADKGSILRTDPFTAVYDAAMLDFCARHPKSKLCGGSGEPDEIEADREVLK